MSDYSAGYRIDHADSGHVHVSVFVGKRPGARGHSGALIFRTDEWTALIEPQWRDVLGWDVLPVREDIR